MNKESLKAKEVLVPFMQEIYDEIYEDWGTGFDVPSEHLHTHLLFLRFNEIFQSIMLLLEKSLAVPAAMQLRPLTEAFIFLKSSVRDDDFHSRYLKHSALQKAKWINYVLTDFDKSAFPKDRKVFEDIAKEIENYHHDNQTSLRQVYQLFKRLDEMDMYLQINCTGSNYLHLNIQTLNTYMNKELKFIPEEERSYKSIYIHTAYSAIYVMIRAHLFHCEMLGITENACSRLIEKWAKHGAEVGAKL